MEIWLDLLLSLNFWQSGMVLKKVRFYLFHQFNVIIIELGPFPFEISIVRQLPEIQILSGETLFVDQTPVESFSFIDSIQLFCEFFNDLLHLVFLLD